MLKKAFRHTETVNRREAGSSLFAYACATIALLFVLTVVSLAQGNGDGGRNTTPPGLAPGAPAGSYALTDFESVNLYSGNLNFTLPLLKVGGRGHVGASVNLSLDSVKWDMVLTQKNGSGEQQQPRRPRGIDETDYLEFESYYSYVCYQFTIAPPQGNPYTFVACRIEPNPTPRLPMQPMQLPMPSGATGYSFFPMTHSQWNSDELMVGYGPGVVRGRYASAWEHYLYPDPLDPRHSDPHNHIIRTLYRMTFVGPDGTEHELVDTLTGGRPVEHSFADWVDRGRVFESTDGSAMTFFADAALSDNSGEPTGYLFLPDGTRCRVEGGLIKWMRDADGNTVSYTYGTNSADVFSWRRVTEIRDTMGRRVTITYADPSSAQFTYDEIKFNGVGGTLNRSIKVWHAHMGDAMRSDQTLKTVGELFAGTNRVASFTPPKKYNPIITSAVELPDGRKYQLRYTSYGEIARAELPTGAVLEYDYTNPILANGSIYRRVKERRSSSDGVNWEMRQTFTPEYVTGVSPDSINGWGTNVTVETHDVKGGLDALVSREKHYFYGDPLLSASPELFYAPWSDGREYKSEQLETTVTNPRVMRRQEIEWRQRETPAWWQTFTLSVFQTTADNAPARDPRVVTTTTAIEPYAGGANLLSKQTSLDPSDPSGGTVGFDRYNNRTDLWEYDFGENGQVGALLRHTHTDYVQTASVGGTVYDYACAYETSCGQSANIADIIHIRGLARAAEVRDAADVVVSRSEFVYDEPSRVGDDYGMLSTDFPGWAAPSTPARGNLTTSRAWLDTLGTYQSAQSYLETHAGYDRFGNAVKAWDARGNASEVKFSADYKYALPTETVSADPDGAGPLTSLNASTVYDFASGVVTDTFDANNRQTHVEYEAAGLDRLRKVTRPDGGWTEYEYGDGVGNLYLHTKTLRESLPNEKVLETYQFFDGMARAVRSTSKTGENTWAATATEYDGVGRASRVTNPYETSDYFGAVPSSALWTTTDYDQLGRVWNVTTPDGAKTVTHFDGLRTLVTDQVGAQRISKSDALGRLTEVWEVRSVDAATGTESVSFPHYADVPDVSAGYKTSYSYDISGNLRKVEQGTQRRYFAYDSLSRLLRVKNPEQDSLATLQLPAGLVSPLSDSNNNWSLKYEYDENGNLKKRIDARGISTDYAYDGLNRVIYRDYSDSTPDVTYTYGNDPAANSKGRLTEVSSSASTYSYTAFDLMGRVTASSQTTGGVTYAMPEYKYDLAGKLTSEKYPSGRVVETQYDAGGRLAGVKKQGGPFYAGGDPSVANNPNVIAYGAHGSVTAVRLGNGLWEHTLYNSRLQPVEIGLGASSTDSSKLKLEYGYSPSVSGTFDPTKNNGNVQSQKISVPAEGSASAQTFSQVYAYDALNRLESAAEVKGTAETWRQTYAYDRFGNRRLDEPHTTKLNSAGMIIFSVDSSNRRAINPNVSASTNRVTEDGYTFDPAGNLLCDPEHPCDPTTHAPHFEYDAEGRITKANGALATGDSTYVYDGEGRRVQKVSGAVTTVMVYDKAGTLMAEYGGTQSEAAGVSYLTQDPLGSTRMVSGQNGEVKSRHDYLPFGDEIDVLKITNSGRENFASYSYGAVRQKFTGYERDAETNLAYAQARYFSSTQGRFTSVDPLLDSAKPVNPQTWNRYSYCGNDPINNTDPSGLDWWYKKEGTVYSPEWHDRDPGADYHRWYNEGGYVYRSDITGKWYALNPKANQALSFDNEEDAYAAYDRFVGLESSDHRLTLSLTQGQAEYAAGVTTGSTPIIGPYLPSIHEAEGLDTTSRDYKVGVATGILLSVAINTAQETYISFRAAGVSQMVASSGDDILVLGSRRATTMYEGRLGCEIFTMPDESYTWEANAARIHEAINDRQLMYQASPFGHYGNYSAMEFDMINHAYQNRRFLGFFIPPPQR